MSLVEKSTQPFTTFTPRSIPGCQVWLDAQDATTLTVGTTVTQWRDKSGSNNHAAPGTAPTYNATTKYILFNGTSQFLQLPNGAIPFGNVPYTIFMVGYTNNNASPQWMMCSGTNVTGSLLGIFINSTSINHSWWVNEYGVSGVVSNNTPFIICISYNLTQRNIVPNGGASSRNTPGIARGSQSGNNFIGKQPGNQWLNGGIGEYIVYNTELSDEDRRQVEGFLARKWSLGVRLPVTHPYKNNIAMRPFQLADVSAPSLWLDSTDASSFVFATGTSNILTWRDKSGNGYDASGINNPVYSPSNVSLNGTTQSFGINLDFLAARSHMAFVVLSNTNFRNIYGARTSNNTTASFHAGLGGTTFWSLNTWGVSYNPTMSNYRAGRRNLAVFEWTASGARAVFANGGQEGTTATGVVSISAMAGGGSIGDVVGQGRLSGTINEIIIYTGPNTGPALNTNQRQRIENFLMTKWNVNLPRLYTPLDVATCAFWFDAADAASVVTSGNNVTLWRDKSGNNRHAAPTVSPTYTGNGITFDGTSHLRASNTGSLLSNAAYSLFLLEVATAGSGGIDCVCGDIGTGGDNAGFLLGYVYNLTWFRYGYWGNDVDYTSLGGTNQLRLWSFNHPSTGNRYFNLYGTNVGTGTSQRLLSFQQFGIGGFGQGGYKGRIYEIICYVGGLTTTQIAQAEGYLAWKWGLQGSLPTGHLYKNAAPTPPASLYRTLQLTPLFTPTIQSNCAVWLDGADSTSITFSGSSITQWNDKSGNNRHAAAQSGNPTYSFADYSLNNGGTPYLLCSNTASLLLNQAYTVFVVENAADVTPLFGDATFVDTTTGASLHATYASSTIFRWGYYNNDLDVTVPGLGSTRIWTFNQPLTANRNIRLNGTLVGTLGNTTKLSRFSALSIMFWWGGSPVSYNGKMYEFILYLGDVTLAQQQRVEGYLAWKWKIQGLLPSTHPYSTFRP